MHRPSRSSADVPRRRSLRAASKAAAATPLPPRPASAVPRRSPHKGPITDQLEAQLSKTARVLSVANEQLAEERRRVLLARRAEAQALAAAALSHQDAERCLRTRDWI